MTNIRDETVDIECLSGSFFGQKWRWWTKFLDTSGLGGQHFWTKVELVDKIFGHKWRWWTTFLDKSGVGGQSVRRFDQWGEKFKKVEI